MRLSPEACSPANVERLLEQVARLEEQLAAAKAAHAADLDAIRHTVQAQRPNALALKLNPSKEVEDLLLLLADMNKRYRLQPPTDAAELASAKEMEESYRKAYEKSSSRCDAYNQFIVAVMSIARKRDLELVWIKGAQLLACYDKMLENPNA